MADATIDRVVPTLNKKRGGAKHYNFVVEGTNFSDDTVVTVTLKKGSDTYQWEIDKKEIHGSTLLFVKLKRKAGGPDTAKEDEIRQIEQITVTVANPPQTPVGLNNVPMGTFVGD